MNPAAPTATLAPHEEDASRRLGFTALAMKGFALAAAVAATTVAICFGVPDGSDLARASLLKHAALKVDAPRKIILVGGSNLMFGVDSNVLRAATNCPVVNMGMNGYFGPKFMLSEVRSNLRPDDIVVMAWEWDNYFKSIDGSAEGLMMVSKTNLETFAYLDGGQLLGVAATYPEIAQHKVVRVLSQTRRVIQRTLGLGGVDDDDPYAGLRARIRSIETLAGFTPDGDLVSHLGVEWPFELEYGMNLVNETPDGEIIPLMVDFTAEMEARGVAAMVSFTPVIDYYYADQGREIDRISAELQANPKLKVPRAASEFVFPPSQHFDTVYHLNAEGRAIRSRMLADDILATFGDRARCDTQNPAT